MKTRIFAFTICFCAILLFGACNKTCSVCTMYDKNNQPLGEYTVCSDNPEEAAVKEVEKTCEGCAVPLTAVCIQEE